MDIDLRKPLAAVAISLIAACGHAPPAPVEAPTPSEPADGIDAVVVHPLFALRYACSEHHEGEYGFVFDALGQDCVVLRAGRTFNGDGERNEDYHIWGQSLLAPFDGVVDHITINEVVNVPGTLGQSPATSIVFRSPTGIRVGYAHISDITVSVGDSIRAGQPFARVSNNGMSSSPHVHVGAWLDDTPLQIRWDLRALGRLRAGP